MSSTAGGAGRDSPIGDDDNEEVRQRSGFALNFVFRFHATLSLHTPPPHAMHLPTRRTSYAHFFPMLAAKNKHDLTFDAQLSENNDFCEACGGSGYLLCCDGCHRSFHFSCLDPPISDDAKELDEPWYCFVCIGKRPVIADDSPQKVTRGLFAPLFSSLKKQNPTNFTLPDEVRNYFEGVATDKNGNFTEALNATKATR